VFDCMYYCTKLLTISAWGLIAKNVGNEASDYFLTDAGAASWQMSKL